MRLAHVVFSATTPSHAYPGHGTGLTRGLAATGASVIGVIIIAILVVLAGIYFIWRSRS